jgi:hypothetical protein
MTLPAPRGPHLGRVIVVEDIFARLAPLANEIFNRLLRDDVRALQRLLEGLARELQHHRERVGEGRHLQGAAMGG